MIKNRGLLRGSFYFILCIGIILIVSGCQKVPEDVKEKSKNYQRAEDVEETDIKYVSIDHILDNQDEILNKTYQNLEFRDTVHLEQPESVSVLSLTVAESFGSKEKLGDICHAFFGSDKYREQIERIEDDPAWIGIVPGLFAFNRNEEDVDDAEVADNGFLACSRKNAELNPVSVNGHPVVCHVDWNEHMDTVYEIDGEKVSIREAVDFVNDWCNKNWAVLEPEYTYQVKTVYICTAENKGNYYYFDVCKFYKGMPFDDVRFLGDDENYYIQNILTVVMEHKNELSFFVNEGNSYDVVKDEVHNDKLIGLEQAVLLAQEKMSGGQKYSIVDIDMKYVLKSDLTEEEVLQAHVSKESPGTPATVRPVWTFVLDYQPIEVELEDEPWPRKMIYVDMVTGEVTYMESFSITQNAQF
ncbi:MAG: hypothetical protein J1E62_04100 [Lachnospiraceae bacterium]|nr:hypothetical protein [Lachnospiraceae bacterium]